MGEKDKNKPLRAGASVLLSAGILLGSAALPFNTLGSIQAEASVVTYETTANLNMRQGASTKAGLILTIPKGKQVEYISQSGAWIKVKYASKEGWVSSSYLKKTATAQTNVAGTTIQKTDSVVAKSNLNLRSTASLKGSKVLTIPKGKELITISKKGDWYLVKYGNKSGWVSADYVKVVAKTTSTKPSPTPPPVNVSNKRWVTTADLNMRNSASAQGGYITTIPKGTLITSNAEKDGWYEVSYANQKGYVSKAYLHEVTDAIAEKIIALEKTPYLMMDLRTKSSVTADQINQYLVNVGKVTPENSVLYNTGQLFIDAGNKYGVNALYLAAHAIHESGFGKSEIAKAKYNLFGFAAYDAVAFIGAMKFDSVASNIDYIAQEMKATYLKPGYWKHKGPYLGYKFTDEKGARIDALSKGMNFYYATDTNWSNAMAQHMEKILPSSKEAAIKQQPNTVVPSIPAVPNLKDVFPANTLAVANKEIVLYDTKGGKTASVTIKTGETFNLLEKWNDFWLTVQYKGQTYYTKTESFGEYYLDFTVKNLARVIGTNEVNVREKSSTSSDSIGKLPLNQFVELILDENQKPIKENTHWYKIKFGDGTAWVHGSYLKEELNKVK